MPQCLYSSEEYKDEVLKKRVLTLQKKNVVLKLFKENIKKSNVAHTEIEQFVRNNKL